MQTLHIQRKASIAGLIVLAGFMLMGCDSDDGKKPLVNLKDSTIVFGKMIMASDLKAALGKSSATQILINFYPIKHSSDSTLKDFDLVVTLQDTGVAAKNLGASVDSALFQKEAGYFASFMKWMGATKADLPHGYFIQAPSPFINHSASIHVRYTIKAKTCTAEYCTDTDGDGIDDNLDTPCDNAWVTEVPVVASIGDTAIGKCPVCSAESQKLRLGGWVEKAIIEAFSH